MSLGGLVAYGDSDDSDEENTDNLQNGEILNSETKSEANTDDLSGTVPKTKSAVDSVEAESTRVENKPVSSSSFIGSVDDIEDDEPVTSQTLVTSSQTSFNALKLPPPKHSDSVGGEGGELFQPASATTAPKSTELTPQSILDENDESTENTTLLLAGLPLPKAEEPKAMSLEMEEDEIEEEIKQKTLQLKTKAEAPPPKKAKRQPVKITIPDLPQYDSDEEEETPAKKKRKPEATTGRTGLFSLLPNPKNVTVKTTNRTLLPHTLTKRPAPAASKPKPVPKPKPAPAPRPLVSGVPDEDSEEEEGDDGETSNFFSLGAAAGPAPLNMAPDVEEPIKPPEPALTGPWQRHTDVIGDVSRVEMTSQQQSTTPAGPSLPATDGVVGMEGGAEDVTPYQGYAEYTGYTEPEPEQSEVQQFLQDEEFLKLAGRRKRGRETIDLIDVQADHQTSAEELTKHITEEVVPGYSYSKKGKDMPSSQQKRKHQITYLAHQAKEREMELKNQWANNRATKKQTQAKYGF